MASAARAGKLLTGQKFFAGFYVR